MTKEERDELRKLYSEAQVGPCRPASWDRVDAKPGEGCCTPTCWDNEAGCTRHDKAVSAFIKASPRLIGALDALDAAEHEAEEWEAVAKDGDVVTPLVSYEDIRMCVHLAIEEYIQSNVSSNPAITPDAIDEIRKLATKRLFASNDGSKLAPLLAHAAIDGCLALQMHAGPIASWRAAIAKERLDPPCKHVLGGDERCIKCGVNAYDIDFKDCE